MKQRIEALTLLRFLAAMLVVTYHFGAEATGAFGAFSLLFAPRMMSFFFTLSGFVLMISYFERTELTNRQFYVARIARVVPLYLLALAITIPFRYGDDIHDLTGLILSATFLQAWVHPYNISFNDPAWSVSVEIFFYALFPLVVYWIRKRNVSQNQLLTVSLVLYLISQAALTYLVNAPSYQEFPSFTHSLMLFFPASYVCSFLLGMTGGLIYLRYKDRVTGSGPLSYLVLTLAFALEYLAITYTDPIAARFGLDLPTWSSFHSVMHTLLILAIAFTDNKVTQVMSWRPFAVLGGASYAVYILQRPFALVYRFLVRRLGVPTPPPLEGFLLFSLLLVVVSVLVFLYFEPAGKRFVRRIEARLQRKGAAA